MIWIEDEALANRYCKNKEGECSIDDAIRCQQTHLRIGNREDRASKTTRITRRFSRIAKNQSTKATMAANQVEEGWAIVKNEKLWPAVFNKEEKIKLLIELGENR